MNLLGIITTVIGSFINFGAMTVLAAVLIPIWSVASFLRKIFSILFQAPRMVLGPQDVIVVVGAASPEGYTLVRRAVDGALGGEGRGGCCGQVIACDSDSTKLHALYGDLPSSTKISCMLMDPTMTHDLKKLKDAVNATGRSLAGVFLVLNSCPPSGELVLKKMTSTSLSTGSPTSASSSTSSSSEYQYQFKQSSIFSLMSSAVCRSSGSSSTSSEKIPLGTFGQVLREAKTHHHSTEQQQQQLLNSFTEFASTDSHTSNAMLRPQVDAVMRLARELGPALEASGKTLGRVWSRGHSRFVVVRPPMADIQLFEVDPTTETTNELDDDTHHELLKNFAEKCGVGARIANATVEGQISELKEIFRAFNVDVVNVNMLSRRRKATDSQIKKFSTNDDGDSASPGRSGRRVNVEADEAVQKIQASISTPSASDLEAACFAAAPSSFYTLPSIGEGGTSFSTFVRTTGTSLKKKLRAVGSAQLSTVADML